MLRLLRTVHGWLGFFVMPWIVVIGLTGIYLNHGRSIYPMLPFSGGYDESGFDSAPDATAQDRASARAIAVSVRPDQKLTKGKRTRYHKRPVFSFRAEDGTEVIVDKATGHYWVKQWYQRLTFSPSGQMLERKIYWGAIFGRLHRMGWIDSSLGTWLADITAGAMAVFGLSGIFLFLVPRIRRLRNRMARRGRAEAAKAAGPGTPKGPAGPGSSAATPPAAGAVPRPRRIRLDKL